MPKRRPVIRHIATSLDGPRIAVAEFEEHVQTWDIESRSRVADFPTTLDFGGRRLAVSPDGKHCAVGAYHVHGISLYDAGNGEEVWRRKDLKKVQTIRFSADGQRLLCGLEGKSFDVLNAATGRSKPALRGVRDVAESSYDECRIVERKKREFKLTDFANKRIATVARTTFAALDFAFSPGKVVISESGGSIRCCDVTSGRELWDFDPGDGSHATELAYNESAGLFVAVTFPYRDGGEQHLITLGVQNGEVLQSTPIGAAHVFAFCSKGSRLISSNGAIWATKDGSREGSFVFFPENTAE